MLATNEQSAEIEKIYDMDVLAPIVLFVYNRPIHTRRTLEALESSFLAEQTDVYIYSDAAKTAQDIEPVNSVRTIIREFWKFKHIYIIEQTTNKGLANSVIDGVTKVVNKCGKVIVLEDDLIVSRFALQYFNDALRVYQNDAKVMHISGYMYPVENIDQLPQTFLFRVPSSWGWATWKDAWDVFQPDIDISIKGINRKSRYEFAVEGSENYWRQVKQYKAGKINSWAIRWYLSMFNHKGLALYPRDSHIQNIGTDGTGTHSDVDTVYAVELARNPTKKFSIERRENFIAFRSIKNFYKYRKGHWMERIVKYGLKMFKKAFR